MELQILKAIGGLGLFLLGMMMLTEGLRSLAGNALRRLLRRSTSSPLQGVVAGALATALVQSSSATTVATVGFVGAGLMSFTQALGIIFGANIGTTITGWLVVIIGFKLQLGTILMPVVLVGALITIFGSRRWRHVGWAIAGFSLLFVGITTMQEGMSFLRSVVSPSDFPSDTLLGRLELVAIGFAVTLVTQSSSAGVATALAALGAGAINLPQAAALVIGMDVGTTFTAALATVGGAVATRRTGFAHVIFNLLIGSMAFFLLRPLIWLIGYWAAAAGIDDPQIALVAFHTTFNLLGVVMVIGFTGRFAQLVISLVPERGPAMTARLDERLLPDPAAAADAVAAAINDITRVLFAVLASQLDRSATAGNIERRLDAVGNAEQETRHYAERIRTGPAQAIANRRHVAAIHALDHLVRLYHRCLQHERIALVTSDPGLKPFGQELHDTVRALLHDGTTEQAEAQLDMFRRRLREARHSFRENTIAMASTGEMDAGDAMLRLDSIRWLHRVSYHVWRIVHHQRIAASEAPPQVPNAEPALEAGED